MKKLSLLILMLAMTGLASAITPTDSQMWWGYFSETNANNLPYDGNLGYSRACTIDAAIYVPANDAFVSSSTIRAIRFWLGYGVTAPYEREQFRLCADRSQVITGLRPQRG